MEKALYEKVIEILARLEDKIDSIDERTQDIEQRLDDSDYERKFGVVR
jgi:DNA replication initiation complex subunit (GINS family)